MSIRAWSPQNQMPVRPDQSLYAPTAKGVMATAAGTATSMSLRLANRTTPT